ncbi:MAG: serine hydrolase domain-containing protein, partial [Litorimonas sp.]
MKFMRAKHIKRVLIAGFLGVFFWTVWPIYGFLSNQFETARLPWGWHELPAAIPSSSEVYDVNYEMAGAQALEALSMRRAKIAAPSISAAVAIDGKLVWAGAIGWRHAAKQLPATVNTTYRIGSTSKAVTATGLARLTAQGTIDLDTPISTYFKDLPNAEWNAFTLRQLASHTAGLTAYEENNDWFGFYQSLALTTRFQDPKQALSVFDGADILFNSQEDFHYSGFDNVLLSAVMQEVAKTSF